MTKTKKTNSKIDNKNRKSHQGGECEKKTKLDCEQEKHNTRDIDKETVTSNSKVTKLWGQPNSGTNKISILHHSRKITIQTASRMDD